MTYDPRQAQSPGNDSNALQGSRVCPPEETGSGVFRRWSMKRILFTFILLLIPIPLIACNASSVMNMVRGAADTTALNEAVSIAEEIARTESWENAASTLAAAGAILSEWQWRPGADIDDPSTMALRMGMGWFSRNHPGAVATVRGHAIFHAEEWETGIDFRGRSIHGWWIQEVERAEIVNAHAG